MLVCLLCSPICFTSYVSANDTLVLAGSEKVGSVNALLLLINLKIDVSILLHS